METQSSSPVGETTAITPNEIRAVLGDRSLVLIGMMGAGKSSVGRRLARRLGLPFVDADKAIEDAAGQSIEDMFEVHGEAYFRDGERRVIERLLRGGPQILATGGGAFMDAETRGGIKTNGISIWLKAELDVLMERVRRRGHRPLLKNDDPEGIMRELLAVRDPVYGKADITVLSRDVPHDVVVDDILTALDALFKTAKTGTIGTPA